MTNVSPEQIKITEENRNIYNALVLNNVPKPLPEKLFVNNFLPFFSGELDIDSEPNFFAMWYGIAGSPSSEVQIIDDNGKELYKVPAIVDTSIINPNRENNDVNFAHIVTMAKLYGNITPTAGQNALNGGLAKKYAQIQAKSKVFTTNEERWLNIFIRYGKVKKSELQVTEAKKAEGVLSDDDFEF